MRKLALILALTVGLLLMSRYNMLEGRSKWYNSKTGEIESRDLR